MLADKDSIIGPYWIPIRMMANNNPAKAPGAPTASQAVIMNNAKQGSTDTHATQKPKIMEPSFLTQPSISNNDLRHYFRDLECTDSKFLWNQNQFGITNVFHADAPWTPWHPAIKATLDPNMHVLVSKCPWTHGHHGFKAALGSKSPWTITVLLPVKRQMTILSANS